MDTPKSWYKDSIEKNTRKFCSAVCGQNKKFKINIKRCSLFVKKNLVSSKIVKLHQTYLEKNPYILPFTKSEVKIISIPANATNSISENVFSSSKLPQRLVFGLLRSANLTDLDRNPYFFEHMDISNVTLSIDNNFLEYRSLNLQYQDKYLLAYQNFVNGLNLESKSIGINRNSCLDGNTLYSFSLCGYKGYSNYYDRSGSLKLDISFSKPLPEAVVVVILYQSQAVLTIDKFNTVTLDQSGILNG